ncbi:hypothetical protein EQY69_13360 [Clostridium perfringens]|nr:hypothetical protein [Clostridium perfringens]
MINKLFLDLNNFKPNLGSVERGDSIELNIKLLNDEDYSRSKFRLLGAKSDGKSVEQIEGLNLEEKDLKVVLEDQFVNCEGIVKLELNVVSEETEITTKEFYFFVSNTMNAEIIDSADSIPTLEKVSKYVDDAINNLETLEQAGKDITVINTEFKENEIKRKATELLREKNEKARLQSEDIRITEEEEREEAELERIKAENNRKVSESNRKVSENTRVTNERAREEAELSRQSTFEENEEIRNSNENLRIASEKERIKFNNKAKTDEVNRNEAETKRVEAENTRVIAEDERKKAETSRQEAEDIRQNTYTNFNEAEEERRNNEISRQEAEALRIEAEKRRDDLYSQKEEERNATFLESERTRDTAFKETQNDRNLTFEESERVREEAFKVSEATRNEAEEGRVAEELLRVKAENNRKVAESKRVETESARVETEKLRVTAETGRVEAESLRVTAEEERVAAETKREEGFNTFEGKINANTEELKNARSATTGEEFNSLDERIDCEFSRLNKKIEVSMLQQEDKESHVVENTVDGMTTDMIVKGRTLQNIFPTDPTKLSISSGSILDGLITINAQSNTYGNMWDVKNPLYKTNTKYSVIIDIIENTLVKGEGTQLNQDYLFIGKSGSQNDSVFSGARSLIIGDGSKGRYIIPLTTISDFSTMSNNYGARIFLSNVFTSGHLKLKIMILEGDWTDKPIPQYFEGIKSFGQEENKISILSHGKNLFDKSKSVQGWISTNGEITGTSDDNFTSDFIPIKPNMNYTKGVRESVGYYDENKKFISRATEEKTFIPPTNAKYMRVVGKPYNAKETFQIEEGAVATQYQPYQSNKKDILLQNLGFDEGLRGFDLTICDELNDIKNVAIKRIGKHIFTGNENIRQLENNTKGLIVLIENIKGVDSKYFISNSNIGYETRWNVNEWENNYPIAFNFKDSNIGNMTLLISKSKIPSVTDIDSLKQYLRENNIELYYQLKEPIETPLIENINVKSFNEKTYVSFENSISGTSSFKIPADTVATIARLNRENRALEEENLKLKEDMIKQTIHFENEDKKMTDYTLDMDFKMCLMEMDIEDIKANLGGDINAKK